MFKSLYGVDYLKNDFRDFTTSYTFLSTLDAKSDNIPFDMFGKDWETMPPHNNYNTAFGNVKFELYKNLGSNYRVGIFFQDLAQISINDGFVKTWFKAKTNFMNLLTIKDINEDLEKSSLKGKANEYDAYGIFLQRVFQINKNHFFSTKIKLNISNKLNYLKVSGETNDEMFHGTIDYYYSDRNFVTQKDTNGGSGYGYGLDLEYIYNYEDFYFYFGGFNLFSYIYWDDISYMFYDLDSKIIYKGEDGYNHYRPFGRGHYIYHTDFTQKLPSYFKSSINYEIGKFAFGDNIDIYDSMYYNEIYINRKIGLSRYKIGYILENRVLIFTTYFKNFTLEISNKFGEANTILQAEFKIVF